MADERVERGRVQGASSEILSKAKALVDKFAGQGSMWVDRREVWEPLAKLEDQIRELRKIVGGGTQSTLDSFVGSVAKAMVGAQKELDGQSLEYARDPETKVPALFRIPKVQAEVKFAFERTDEKGVNLLFYKDQTNARELHQQSLCFEIVSVPPPPGLLEALNVERGRMPQREQALGSRDFVIESRTPEARQVEVSEEDILRAKKEALFATLRMKGEPAISSAELAELDRAQVMFLDDSAAGMVLLPAARGHKAWQVDAVQQTVVPYSMTAKKKLTAPRKPQTRKKK